MMNEIESMQRKMIEANKCLLDQIPSTKENEKIKNIMIWMKEKADQKSVTKGFNKFKLELNTLEKKVCELINDINLVKVR